MLVGTASFPAGMPGARAGACHLRAGGLLQRALEGACQVIGDDVDPVSVPRDATQDVLTQAVLANITQANPAAGISANEFRKLLGTANAVTELQTLVQAYVARVKNALDLANPAQRKAELERLYGILVERRRLMLSHPVLKNLDETNGQLLLPLPNQ